MEDEELDPEESKQAAASSVNLEERKITFCVEGIESQVWQEYMTATPPRNDNAGGFKDN